MKKPPRAPKPVRPPPVGPQRQVPQRPDFNRNPHDPGRGTSEKPQKN